MNYKRKKPRTHVRCSMCTPIEGRTNSTKGQGRHPRKSRRFWPKIEET